MSRYLIHFDTHNNLSVEFLRFVFVGGESICLIIF